MRNDLRKRLQMALLATAALVVGSILAGLCAAQNPEIQQRFAQLKESMAKNKQALAQYTWVETDTISLKGQQKKQEQFQVRLGPDGKPQKTPLDQSPAPGSSGREGRLKKHIVEKKKEEYKDYAGRIKSLIQRYVPPEKDLLQQAFQQGNIAMGPQAGAPGQFQLIISNYVKQGDRMTLVIDRAQKSLESLSIATYLDDPKDAVNVTVAFDRVPGGPNHVSSQTINGVSKQLTIAVQNSNYQKL